MGGVAEMRIRKVDRKIERHILIGMIVSTNYLSFISTKIDKHDLQNSYASIVAGWCLDYFKKYEKAPGKHIQEIFEYHNKKEEIGDNEVDMIEKLLEEISEQYSEQDDINVDFLLDKTEEYLKKNEIQRVMVDVENKLNEGNVKGAENEILNMKPVQITSKDGLDPLVDIERVQNAFENVAEPVLKLEGAFGELLNEHLTRDSFVCFQAPEKSGKTWLIYWLGLQGLMQKRNVALFQIGDMTENQSIIRLSILLCKKSNKKKYCGKFRKPAGFIALAAGRPATSRTCPDGYDIQYEDVDLEKPLSAQEAHDAYMTMCEELDIKNHFRLFTRPADTISFTDIDSELDRMEKQEGWIPDIVIVDYMDLARCEERVDSERAGINKIWKKAKSLDNKRHLLLISATQADAETYTGDVQTRNNYSEDKRKYSHVNAMIGMSQTDAEKKDGIMKFNTLVSRDGEYITSSVCYVLQSLRTGEPVVDSVFCSEPRDNHRRRQPNENNRPEPPREQTTVSRRRPVRGGRR